MVQSNMGTFDWILETSIIASVLIIIILAIRALINKRVSPMIVYYMWFIVIIKLVIPYGPESNISIYNIFTQENNTSIYNLLINNEITKEGNNENYEEELISLQPNINSTIKDADDNLKDGNTEFTAFLKTFDNKLDNLTLNQTIYFIWIIGISLLILRGIYSYFQIHNLIRGKIYSNDRVKEIMLESLKLLCFNKEVEIVVSEKFDSPALFGVLNPKIIIPKNIMDKCSNEELKYIFLHELSHLKRKDNIVIWISWAIKTIYWFNPIILLSMKLMQNDSELACDSTVLRKIDDKENIDYGKTILNVLSSINHHRVYVGTTTMIRNKKDVKERIYMISKNKKYGLKTFVIGVALIVTVGVIGLTSEYSVGTSDAEKIKQQESNMKSTSELISEKTESEIVIYNTHYEEGYDNGLTVIDGAEILAENMKSNGVGASFLKNVKESPNYNKLYELSRELIVEGIDKYDDKVLIDFHRESFQEPDEHKRDIVIILSESSPRYEANKLYANKVNDYLNSIGVVSRIFEYKTSVVPDHNFNLDLSDKSLSINVGSSTSSKEDLEFCANELTKAINQIK